LARNAAAQGMGGLWAREKVAALMASLRDGAPEAEVRARVIEVATAHRLVTKYTSFVAVDRTPARAADESLKTAAVPTLLPAGWEYDKVFGELPQGSTGSRLALLIGLVALMLSAALFRKRT
jgi:Ca-activated chloride channel family protein